MNNLTACLHAVSNTISRVEHENRLVNKYTARDFTPFRFMSWGEVPSTHMLAFFLDPGQDHGQGALFQELFIRRLQTLPVVGPRVPAGTWRIHAERRHADYGQIDLLLTATDVSFGICVENKPREQTIDQENQLTSYRAFLQEQHKDNYLLLYLSNKDREPSSSSMDPKERENLTGTGHYVNLTYRDFVLPLLDDWYQAVHPESLRIFFRQFRHHIEGWLQFESTKPASLSMNQQIVSTLIMKPEYVQAAFGIADSLTELKRQLLTNLINGLKQKFPELEIGMHWKYPGFINSSTRKALLLRRPSATDSSIAFPWERSAIAIEFDNNKRLFYGIRFDKVDLIQGDSQGYSWPDGAPAALAEVLQTPVKEWESWLWWDWVGPENDLELYPQLADGALLTALEPKIARLRDVLNEYYSIPHPMPTP